MVSRMSASHLEASWEPNFRPALPSLTLCIVWLFLLCLTLPSASTSSRLLRLASFPPLAIISAHLAFDRTYTCGNPLRDLLLPTLTWSITCKAVEICLVYSAGGPRLIRPFLPDTSGPVAKMQASKYDQYQWQPVDFPKPLSWGRIVYGLDVLFLRRPGTSMILPKQGRALEWSKRGLNEWASYLKIHKCQPHEIPAHSPVRRFGEREMPLLPAFLQIAFVWTSFSWWYAVAAPSSEVISVLGFYVPIDSSSSRSFLDALLPAVVPRHHLVLLGAPASAFALPLLTRFAMVITVGGAVFLAPGFLESLMLLVWKPFPATCFLSAFEQPLTSPGLGRFWARSWHATSQRDYLNMASMLPFSNHPALQVLYVFFWSGVQHSLMFARLRTDPSAPFNLTTILTYMLDPGMMTFFLSQGIGILIERAVLDALPISWKKQRSVVTMARRIWMFSVLLVAGCAFLDSILEKQLFTKDILDGFSPSALGLMLAGKKYDLSRMWISTPILALTQLITTLLTPSPPPAHPSWSGSLPPFPDTSGSLVSACTFAVGPPGPPASALCPAFDAFCTKFRDDIRSHHIRTLKSHPPLSPRNDDDDEHDPLSTVKFRTGCTGGSSTSSDGSYISAYTATCIVDGVDWVPFVFDQFLKAEFSEKGSDRLPIWSSFVGCQVPARL
ncbi:hypothetical protein PHSY_004718 [Pseudozyma hubeiensis SY62]|uniref:Wax synthase domain-containing protein n=1 Tax=Pseudozyma hubeiensis (strain SY62) TaxID=1305764 RepID=R9P6V1_PSEHS|nr:hypothetical protein PHSY_004718 [Pseudozyma hubeiensis SY62]GAC97133.1 hypothetical protein PHSY_004718 [Pseudozyma hubeiensis SY62]